MARTAWIAAFVFVIAACGQQAPQPAAPRAAPAPAAAAKPAAPAATLADVMETTPQYIAGISYPQEAAKYPGLAAELKRYADAARTGLLEAVQRRPADAPPYDLTLGYTLLHESPALVAVAADGSRYTGGAHAEPLLARFVWLPGEDRLLTAAALVPSDEGWNAIATHVRGQLRGALAQQLEAAAMPPAERAQAMKNAAGMIEKGTAPEAAKFAMFEPVMTPQGTIAALRFVFPPYQVGPYSDGAQTVEVPAALLLPHVAPQYRRLFAGAAGAAG